LCAPSEGGDRRDGGEELPDRDIGAAGHYGPCRADREPSGENAAEIDLLLPEDSHRDGVQLAEKRLKEKNLTQGPLPEAGRGRNYPPLRFGEGLGGGFP